ncbi:MAG: ABC transporter ATP-binding protein [Proteobacteria bacterium]|nr:ABC transporter ATP-binding protein [Pseudomonadota bacterium]
MEDIVLETMGLKKDFISPSGDTINVLKGIDFTVKKGDTISVVGASGSGKTTFLHIIGLLDKPSEGIIKYFGKTLEGTKDIEIADFRNKNIGFIFQMHYLLPEFNALENAMMPLIIRGAEFKDAEEKAKDLFDKVNLSHRLYHKPGQLSGGEQQKVSLIRAFIGEPKIILADEPTGNLDKKNANLIAELFLKLNDMTKTSIVMVTHNEELAKMMSRICKLDDGVLLNI